MDTLGTVSALRCLRRHRAQRLWVSFYYWKGVIKAERYVSIYRPFSISVCAGVFLNSHSGCNVKLLHCRIAIRCFSRYENSFKNHGNSIVRHIILFLSALFTAFVLFRYTPKMTYNVVVRFNGSPALNFIVIKQTVSQ